MTDEYYMQRALEQARLAFDKDEVPVGAVVVCRDRIIARAHNLTETLNDVTAHAEMQAITAAANALGGKYLDVCTLYVTVEPCVMCAGALGWAQTGRVVYGAADPKAGCCGGLTDLFALPFNHHPVIEKGLCEEQATALMQQFFERLRQKRQKKKWKGTQL